MILDTSFVIDVLNGKKDAIDMLGFLEERNIEYAISTPTIFEIWSGLISLKKGEKHKNEVISFLKEQIVYDLDVESTQKAGQIHGSLVSEGKTINPIDCMIAGIAIANNKKVLTRDEHFKRIEGLKIESY